MKAALASFFDPQHLDCVGHRLDVLMPGDDPVTWAAGTNFVPTVDGPAPPPHVLTVLPAAIADGRMDQPVEVLRTYCFHVRREHVASIA